MIGGGAAGLSAATWLARYRRHVLVLDAGEQRNRWVEHAHGYLGFDPCDPMELLERGRADLKRYETADILNERVSGVEGSEGGFLVRTDAGEHEGRRLVLATGVADEFPDVEGFFEHYGIDVFHCPSCDGYDARDRDTVVFGWGEHVTGFARHLLRWASSVTIVTDGHRLEADDADRAALADERIRVIEDVATSLEGERGALRTVCLRDAGRIPCRIAFFTIAHHPVNRFAHALGCSLTDEGYVVVDAKGRTTVEGVYAAGDLTPGFQLLQVGAAEGAVAGIACAISFGV